MVADGCKGLLAVALTSTEEMENTNAIAKVSLITIFDLETGVERYRARGINITDLVDGWV